jgi:hypothetical protein
MAEPKTQYEYGRTPEQTEGGLLGLFDMIRGPVADALTPERRVVITPPQTTYENMDGYAYRTITPGVYGPPERNLEYMPVVQGARSAADFAGKFFSDGKFREQTGSALAKGVGQMFSDYIRSASQGGETTYDPVEKREVKLDPLLPLGLGMAASMVAPVKGSGAVLGMFAGRHADTADLDALKVAQKMETRGNSRDEIWDQTGWFRYNDRGGKPMGEWKFEIRDDLSSVVTDPAALKPYLTETGRVKKGSGQTGYGPEIDKLLVHDELYKAYNGGRSMQPLEGIIRGISDINEETRKLQVRYGRGDLTEPEFRKQYGLLLQQKSELQGLMQKGLPINGVPGGTPETARETFPLMDRPIGDTVLESTTTGSKSLMGYYKPHQNTMAVRNDYGDEAFRSTALHELQHAIQSREGFESGGSSQEFGKYGLGKRPIIPETGDQLTPFQTYQGLVGEQEARLVQSRRDMDLIQRRDTPPYSPGQPGAIDESRMYTRKELGVEYKAGGFVDKPSTTTHTDGEGSEEVSQESYMEALASGRPLADGDRRVNPDGSHSTELSISWPEKDGSWVLAPSLWRTPSGLVELPEELARNVARAYEERASMRFPRFKTQEEMSKFARERSAGGGATNTPLATPIPRPRPNATRPGVEYKAGGFVDKPLYSDARIGKMI